MEWFENVKGTVKKTASIAYEKSSQIIEITKLNFQISDMEATVDKYFKELGMKVYEEYKNGSEINEESKVSCESIDAKYEEIEELKNQIAALKNVNICPECSFANPQDNNYCAKCGAKLEN
jgi:ribosomal protein L40E